MREHHSLHGHPQSQQSVTRIALCNAGPQGFSYIDVPEPLRKRRGQQHRCRCDYVRHEEDRAKSALFDIVMCVEEEGNPRPVKVSQERQ